MLGIIKAFSKNFPLLITAILICLQAMTAFLIKKVGLDTSDNLNFFKVIFNIFYILSLLVFALRGVLWQILLLENSIVKYYPILSLNFVLILILGYFFFEETITIYNIIGTLLIIIGTFYLSKKV